MSGTDQAPRQCLIIVMGVSGTGKSTLGKTLSEALNMPFVEGDDLHPRSNVDKMSSGHPLTDEDREPWLELIRRTAEGIAREQRKSVVVTCSALKNYYREILRGRRKPTTEPKKSAGDREPPPPDDLPAYFVFIKGDRATLLERMEKREDHFMKANMLDSQLATLENPEGEEGVVVVDLQDTTEKQVEAAMVGLGKLGRSSTYSSNNQVRQVAREV